MRELKLFSWMAFVFAYSSRFRYFRIPTLDPSKLLLIECAFSHDSQVV